MAARFRDSAFPREEYELRWKRSRDLMERNNLDALLISSPSNYRYFVGTEYGWGSRRNVFLLPSDKEPVALVNGAQKYSTELTTYINDVRWYDLPFRTTQVVEIISDLGLSKSRIGAELKHDYMTNIPYEVKQVVDEAEFVDATEILQELRMIKTKNEIEAIRAACLQHTTALLNMMERIRGGMTIREISWALAQCERDQGVVHLSTTMLPNIWNVDGKGEWRRKDLDLNRKLRNGDYVSFDAAIVGSKGYGADFGATFVVGEPEREHIEWWEKCVHITKGWMEITRPNIRMSDAHKLACKSVSDVGLDPNDFSGCYAIHRAHYAHGTGIDLVEEPMCSSLEHREFRPGMTLCIEPGLEGREAEGAPKTMHREEEIVVTENGCERLTTMGWDLRCIPEK